MAPNGRLDWSDDLAEIRHSWKAFLEASLPTTPIRGRTPLAWVKACEIKIPPDPNPAILKDLHRQVGERLGIICSEIALLTYHVAALEQDLERKASARADEIITKFLSEHPGKRPPGKEMLRNSAVVEFDHLNGVIGISRAELSFFKCLERMLMEIAGRLDSMSIANAHLLKIHQTGWDPTEETESVGS